MGRLGIWQKELPCLLKARVRPAFTGQDCTEPQTMRREFLETDDPETDVYETDPSEQGINMTAYLCRRSPSGWLRHQARL